MKKMLGLFVAVAVLAASSLLAFAAEIDAPITEAVLDGQGQATGAYITSGSHESLANTMMTILVVVDSDDDGIIKAGDINVDSIMYIDQIVADGEGAYSFANYIPKFPVSEHDYIVLVGGQTISTPLQSIIKGEVVVSDLTYAGTITYTGKRTPAEVALYQDNEKVAFGETDAETGAFSFTAASGTYKLVVSKSGHLSYTKKTFVLEESIDNAAHALTAGDADGSGLINLLDLTTILQNFGKAEVIE